MARARSPDRDNAYKIWCDSGGDKKLTEIAQELGVSDALIRKWKNQDKWGDKLNGDVTNGNSNATNDKKVRDKKKKLLKQVVESVDANENLTEKQRLFCIYYASNNNAVQSYLKAYGCSYATARVEGYVNLARPSVKAEVKQLKAIMRAELDVDITDMLNYCLRVVGADIGDYVTFGQRDVPLYDAFGNVIIDKNTTDPLTKRINYIDLAASDTLDTTIISEVKQGKSGISIKLADKNWAWDQLAKYFDWLPDKHKRQIDNARLEIERAKSANNSSNDEPINITIKRKEVRQP